MTPARRTEILRYHLQQRKQGVKLHPKIISFRKWFAEDVRTEEEIKKWWQDAKAKYHANGSRATEDFIKWLQGGIRTRQDCAQYWKDHKRTTIKTG